MKKFILLALAAIALSSCADTFGVVSDAVTGKGIKGVRVSDGHNFAVTNFRGAYRFTRDTAARKIFYVTPENYEFTIGENGLPKFYSDGILEKGVKVRADFQLTPGKHDKYTIVAMGDSQCRDLREAGRFTSETVPDMEETFADAPAPMLLLLGDIGYDNHEMWAPMKEILGNIAPGGKKLPVFAVIGNHDHDSTAELEDGEAGATLRFTKEFGPVDYSFDRPGAHIVVLDNIMVQTESWGESTNLNGRKWKYKHDLYDYQREWLRQDLELVPDKAEKTLFVCMHGLIRYMERDSTADALLSMFSGWKNVHLLTAHSHVAEDRILDAYTSVSGNPFFEHTQATACGDFWYTNSDVDGTPTGYEIFDMEDGTLQNYISKGVHKSLDYRMRIYDGRQKYSGALGDTYSWYDETMTSRGRAIALSPQMGGGLIAEVFDSNEKYWKVELFNNGEKVGDFIHAPHDKAAGLCYMAYVFNDPSIKQKNKRVYANKYWYINVDPGTLGNWEVVATQTIPDSGRTNVYRCSRMTTDYTEF